MRFKETPLYTSEASLTRRKCTACRPPGTAVSASHTNYVQDIEVRGFSCTSLTPYHTHKRKDDERKNVGDEDHNGDHMHLGSVRTLGDDDDGKQWLAVSLVLPVVVSNSLVPGGGSHQMAWGMSGHFGESSKLQPLGKAGDARAEEGGHSAGVFLSQHRHEGICT